MPPASSVISGCTRIAWTVPPKIGAPLVKGASVQCEIVDHGQGEKVIAFKKKRRKNTHRKRGHRQHFTTVKVLGITAG